RRRHAGRIDPSEHGRTEGVAGEGRLNRRFTRRSGMLTRMIGAGPSIIVLLLLHATPLAAQAVKGGLLGNITDQGGLAVPGATVTITETSTNISSTAVTNESGYYVFSNLKDGTYKVVAELPGFKKVIRDGIIVPVNATIRV